jgi:tellurite resistance protein
MKEWNCTMRSSAFVIIPASLCLLAFAITDRFDNADTLAKVLFWIGAPITLAFALYLAARWITDLYSMEHLFPSMMLPPTACFVAALVGPFLDSDYTEAMYLWFSFAVVLVVPLYVISFHRSLVFKDPDDRHRPLKWIWVAVLSMACAAEVVLQGGSASSGIASEFTFSFASRLLYFASLSLAMVLGLLFVNGYSVRGKFDASSSWSYAFPLEALAIATLMYAAAVPGDLSRGMAYAGLAVSSTACVVLGFHTLHAILMARFWTMDPKYGPLSQQILTHEAFRASGEKLKLAVAALDPTSVASGRPALADFARQFRKYRLAHAWHAEQEEKVIFREFETYVPGFCSRQHDEHAKDEASMARWEEAIQIMESAAGLREMNDKQDDSSLGDASAAVSSLQTEIPAFVDEFENHLQGEEQHLQRGGRKHLNLELQKQMIRKIWDTTPVDVLTEFIPWVVQNLPMHMQRVKFVRCFATWAVPERAQLIGRMIALGVDAATWERLVEAVPEIAPRGARGWRRHTAP